MNNWEFENHVLDSKNSLYEYCFVLLSMSFYFFTHVQTDSITFHTASCAAN